MYMRNTQSGHPPLSNDQHFVTGCNLSGSNKKFFAGRKTKVTHSPEVAGWRHSGKMRSATGAMLLLLTLFLSACSSNSKQTRVEISTRQGDIIIELYPGKAPKSVAAFLSYIKKDLYNNASFYRVLNDDNQPSNAAKANVIQGGLYRSKNMPEISPVPHETTKQTGILHKDGTLSLARREPGTATTEFFICLGDQPGFDFGGANNPDGQGYAAFGRVIKGMDVVRKIYNMPEDDQYFDPPVPIFNIEKL